MRHLIKKHWISQKNFFSPNKSETGHFQSKITLNHWMRHIEQSIIFLVLQAFSFEIYKKKSFAPKSGYLRNKHRIGPSRLFLLKVSKMGQMQPKNVISFSYFEAFSSTIA